jgi:hypothetical protein
MTPGRDAFGDGVIRATGLGLKVMLIALSDPFNMVISVFLYFIMKAKSIKI